MASVSSLDKDLRNMRLGKYTPQAANEVRAWIEESLGEQLTAGDLLDALKDGTALCKLVNLATGPPGVRFKQSSMPFVQMENISHFLRACKSPPLNLQAHDIFQTVDLYENKDPAQVLTCISAFSRRANAIQPSKFPAVIGARSKASRMSPESTGGYAPKVPSLAEKERKRRDEEAEAEHLRLQAEELEHKRRSEREAEEEREKAAEEESWAEETRKQREVEKIRIEEEKRRWAEEERKWKEEEEARAREEQEAELRLAKERQQTRTQSDARLTGQFLSQYQAEQRKLPIPPTSKEPHKTPEALRVEQLERELEKAKEREAQYERERQERMRQDRYNFEDVDSALQRERQRDISPSTPVPVEPRGITAQDDDNDSWQAGE
ncbi:MAG: hypothetical protein Q9223_007902, partial [Gallowayella weberi]